jgi:tetratricopeptide (TPR) repeat protein
MRTMLARLHERLLRVAAVIVFGTLPPAMAQHIGPGKECGILRPPGQFGPFDYRTATRAQREVVEIHHFDREYKALSRGLDRIEGMQGNVVAGFAYTLRALPNHHLALEGMERISVRRSFAEKLEGSIYRLECWFLRAIEMAPDDGIVRALYGLYLARRKRGPDAEAQLAEAERLAPDDPNALIQMASAYLTLARYADAQRLAQRAYDNGYPLYGLRDRMVAMGKWQK